MTSTTPRPMQTPDLASLLGKPARRPRTEPDQIPTGVVDPPTSVDFDARSTIDADTDVRATLTSPDAPRTTPDTASSPRPKRGTAARRTEPGKTAIDPGDTGTTPSGRQYLRTIALYIPRSLHRTLGERADATGTTRTALILTAVNQRHQDLPSALRISADATAGDLFDIPQQRADKEPSVHTTIRVTDRQLTAIDHLVQQLETNRSALVAAALRLHLN